MNPEIRKILDIKGIKLSDKDIKNMNTDKLLECLRLENGERRIINRIIPDPELIVLFSYELIDREEKGYTLFETKIKGKACIEDTTYMLYLSAMGMRIKILNPILQTKNINLISPLEKEAYEDLIRKLKANTEVDPKDNTFCLIDKFDSQDFMDYRSFNQFDNIFEAFCYATFDNIQFTFKTKAKNLERFIFKYNTMLNLKWKRIRTLGDKFLELNKVNWKNKWEIKYSKDFPKT